MGEVDEGSGRGSIEIVDWKSASLRSADPINFNLKWD
jgi:hypothetical protein